jgi:multiple sugar transport system permease protein
MATNLTVGRAGTTPGRPGGTRGGSVARRRPKHPNLWKGLAFASPFLLGFLVLIAYPMIASGIYSFTNFNLFQAPKFVGLANYQAMFADSTFWKSLYNTLFMAVIGVPLTIIIGLAGAHVLNFPIKGQPVYRALIYIPVIVPVVVGSYLWRWMLNSQYGYVDRVLGFLHLPQPAWLTEPAWGKPAILMIALWTIGSTLIIYMAAIRDIPQELYEAAQMDGAGPWRRFVNITWPKLTPVTLFQVIVVMISYLQIFTQPYLLTQATAVGNGGTSSGGAGDSMLSMSMYLFENAFSFLKMGYASALAWALFLLTLVITLLVLWSSKKWVHYDNND